ncbi:MFS transporter [Pseudonocardia spinosispora]|uniref:MFS transporter n=1 Tax=Pseudonocardia spinosispora TaxID=103441 RepID=UPI000417EFC2|nr:MFS transporter [Pseudonocardia spinosispora]
MASSASTAQVDRNVLYRKITRRIVPLLVICYMFAYLDRVNIGFAKFGLERDLNIGDAAYGFAAGIFFIGYVLFELPSNLLLTKIGARSTFTRILVLWGLVAAGLALAQGPTSLYVLRFLLGVFEAGFAPGMIFFLGLWFPPSRMAGVMGTVMLAIPVASIFGGPLATWLITTFEGVAGLHGWQWMFVLTGLPCVALAAVTWRMIVNRPSEASWLSDAEKAAVAEDLANEHGTVASRMGDVLRMPKVYLLAVSMFSLLGGAYAMSFWLPTILRDNGVTDLVEIGLLSSVPYVVTFAAMFLIGRRSDRTGERRWHCSIPAAVGAAALAVAALTNDHFLVSFAALTIGTAAIYCSYTVFWAIPSSLFRGTAAAGAIAVINSIGLLGGFVSPTLIGYVRQNTGSTEWGLLVMVALVAVAVVLLIIVNPPKVAPVAVGRRERTSTDGSER